MEYKKKLTDIFLRKQEKSKKEIITQKPKIIEFDESYFEAKLQCDNVNTSLMKINAIVKKGPDVGEQIPLKCRWYSKNQFDFKQIEEIKTNFFQPCLEDIGNVICVQIEPQIESMVYTGITIMKESDVLKMDRRLQQMANEYFVSRHLQMEGKIETMYSQDERFQRYEFPIDVVIELRQNRVVFRQKATKQVVTEYGIDEDFPVVDFNRKSFNSILLTCSQCESMKLSLSNNFNRDLFGLIIRSIPNRLTVVAEEKQSQQMPNLLLNSHQKAKSSIDSTSQETTKLILKLDESNKEIKNLKKINEELKNNYHSERTAKINLQNQIQKLKSRLQKVSEQHKECKHLHTKIKQVTEQNKFYFGQLALMKTQVKQKVNIIKELKYELDLLKQINKNLTQNIKSSQQTIPTSKISQLTQQLNKTKQTLQNFETDNQNLKDKINNLENQNNLLKKKLTSITNEKSLPNTPVKQATKSIQNPTPQKDASQQIQSLKMQITNLQMLLKHKKGEKGGDLLSMHYLINSLTEKIAEKQIEIESLKKINREITKKVSAFNLNKNI